MYKLVIQDDEGKTTVVPLIRDELTIGRKEGNTIRLTERNVSRAHARLTRANGTVVIEDLNSYNGIRVNGSRIQGRATIAETDRVQIGDYLIEIRSAAAEAGASDETQPLDRLAAKQAETTQMPEAPEAGGTPPPLAAAAVAAAPPEVVGLTDTDPGRAAASSVSNHGRLVVLSTNFAGQDFVLDKPSMVIGRTDENDIWLNHRSISRHHAKIVLENGRYSIEDLQSSNGVRVNGEEYGKVELRRADAIDLGHVRLRFVEPGEDFVFGRDAQAVEVFPEGGSKTWLYAGIGGVLLIGAVALFMVLGSGNGKSSAGAGSGTGDTVGSQAALTPDAAAVPMAELDAAVVAVEADAAAEVPDPGVDPEEVKKALSSAGRLLKQKKWADAIIKAEEVLELDPGNADAEKIVQSARRETTADENYKLLQAASSKKRYREVNRLKNKFSGSQRSAQAARIVSQAINAEAAAAGRRMRSLARQRKCDEFKRVYRSIVFVRAKKKVESIPCEKEETPPGDGDGDGDKPTIDVKAKEGELTSAIRGGSFGKAYSLCDELLKAGKASANVRKKCMLAACRDGNVSRARSYRRRIRASTAKAQLTNLCATSFKVKLD